MLAAGRFVLTRLAAVVGVALFVSFVTFFLLRVSRDPVDVVGAARSLDVSSPSVRSELAAELGTDRPLIVQYGDWLSNAVRGELGTSYLDSTDDVAEGIGRALPVNLELVILAALRGRGVVVR